jgi:hypothetical protein
MMKERLTLARTDDYDETKECTNSFTPKYGLPCKHFLEERITRLRSLNKDAVFLVKLFYVN